MTTNLPNIVKQIEEYVLNIYNEQGNHRLLFHDYRRTMKIVHLIEEMTLEMNLSPAAAEKEIAQVSAWFELLGYIKNFKDVGPTAARLAQQILQDKEYAYDKISRVKSCLMDAGLSSLSLEAQLFHDAKLAYWSNDDFMRLSPLMRLEEELLGEKQYSHLEWEEAQLDRLLESRYYTSFAQLTYTPVLQQNIIEQKKKTDTLALKIQRKKASNTPLRHFQRIEESNTKSIRGAQTYFRAVYRNHINLSTIADNKANMMTGINALMISVVISIMSYSNLLFHHPLMVVPMVIFLISALVSLIFSIVSASPRVTKMKGKAKEILKTGKNIAFFGNFTSLSLEEYEDAIDKMLRDDELLYGNMSRDLYFLGITLDIKFKLLRISYFVFLGGFVVSVLAFLFVLITTN